MVARLYGQRLAANPDVMRGVVEHTLEMRRVQKERNRDDQDQS